MGTGVTDANGPGVVTLDVPAHNMGLLSGLQWRQNEGLALRLPSNKALSLMPGWYRPIFN